MKRLGLIAMLLGLGLIIALVLHEGAADIGAVLSRAGLVLCWLIPLHLIPLTLDARAWQVLLLEDAPALPYLTWIAAVREAVNRLLPAANVGGEVLGIRLARMRVARPGAAASSVIVEVLLTMIGQYLMCAAGVVLTLLAVPDMPQQASIVMALVLSLVVPLALLFLLRRASVFTHIEVFAKKLVGGNKAAWSGFNGPALDQALKGLLKRHGVLARALGWQLAGMLLGAGETWLALLMLGHPVGVSAALSIEALTLLIRSAAFFVPGGLGIQEAGIIMLGQLFGIDSSVALSLALVRRMREIVMGVPALLSWQWFEARRYKHQSEPESQVNSLRAQPEVASS
jgi:putative membrane protein